MLENAVNQACWVILVRGHKANMLIGMQKVRATIRFQLGQGHYQTVA